MCWLIVVCYLPIICRMMFTWDILHFIEKSALPWPQLTWTGWVFWISCYRPQTKYISTENPNFSLFPRTTHYHGIWTQHSCPAQLLRSSINYNRKCRTLARLRGEKTNLEKYIAFEEKVKGMKNVLSGEPDDVIHILQINRSVLLKAD